MSSGSLHIPKLVSGVAVASAFIAGCVAPPSGGGDTSVASGASTSGMGMIEDYVLVDCMLTGQVRRLGSMIYVSHRKPAKITARDCAREGGEYVLFDRSDYSTALSSLLPDANAGNAVAQTYVGEIYENGLGRPGPDYAKAAFWYRKAADQGHRPAQIRLGALHERGLGVARDKIQAGNLYRKGLRLDQDELAFKSDLEAERAAFRSEMATRRQQVASLRSQLRSHAQTPPGGAVRSVPSSAEKNLKAQLRDAEARSQELELEVRAAQQRIEEGNRKLQQARSDHRADRVALEEELERAQKSKASRQEARDEIRRFVDAQRTG